MPLLANLDPMQKKILTFGVPVAAALAIGTIVKGRGNETADAGDITDEGATGGGGGTSGFLMPSTDAIGTGELGQFQSNLTDYLIQLQKSIDDGLNKPTTTTSGSSGGGSTTSGPPADMVETVLRRMVTLNGLAGLSTWPGGKSYKCPKPGGAITTRIFGSPGQKLNPRTIAYRVTVDYWWRK